MEKKAIALAYDALAPRVVAKARRELAEKLLKLAADSGVPVYEDKNLVALLDRLDIESTIPPELFCAMAEVFAHCYRVNQTFRNKLNE